MWLIHDLDELQAKPTYTKLRINCNIWSFDSGVTQIPSFLSLTDKIGERFGLLVKIPEWRYSAGKIKFERGSERWDDEAKPAGYASTPVLWTTSWYYVNYLDRP